MSDSACDLLCIDFDRAEALRSALPDPAGLARVTDRLRALGDPTRLRLAHALQVGDELCVCDLAWIIGSSQGLVSHHLRQLRTVELVESRRDGKLVMYRLTSTGQQLLATLATLASPTRFNTASPTTTSSKTASPATISSTGSGVVAEGTRV